MSLAETVYRQASRFPKPEAHVLATQLRRSAISVPSNIAEGAGRSSARELAQFINIASGFLAELDTQIQLAVRLGYMTRAWIFASSPSDLKRQREAKKSWPVAS